MFGCMGLVTVINAVQRGALTIRFASISSTPIQFHYILSVVFEFVRSTFTNDHRLEPQKRHGVSKGEGHDGSYKLEQRPASASPLSP